MDKIVALAKRRGFIYPGSEIYGGLTGFWDYGPLGVELKNNLKREWWKSMVYDREDVVGLDAAIIMNPQVWEASGHVSSFTDPLIECKKCHRRYRFDQIKEVQQKISQKTSTGVVSIGLSKKEKAHAIVGQGICPNCGSKDFTDPKTFNLLTEVFLGVTEPKQKAYLRGEITQGVFVNFRNVVDSTRMKIPFGIAQIGKAFRNEITPGNFTFRSREFEQMELEFFIKPEENEGRKWFDYWREERMKWYKSLSIKASHLRFRDHEPKERAHYARQACDIEYQAPFGWSEFEGIHHRGDWDLGRHKLTYKDPDTGEEYTPWVIETSGGVDRAALFFLIAAYREEEKRVVLSLHPRLAPNKVAVFPLVANKPQLVNKAQVIYQEFKKRFMAAWDDRGNIGKRYLAQDEVGTPWCVTVDYDTLESDTVTVRDRDTTRQERVAVGRLTEYLEGKLEED
ncbi:MAG: glycine--tRNA ligase [Patescibacteria group bacterium]